MGHFFNSISRKIFGTIALVSADNLAANALGGFKEAPSANLNCRQCMGTHLENSTEVCKHYMNSRSCH